LGGVAQRVVGEVEGPPDAVAVGEGRDGGDLADDAPDLLLAHGRIVNVLGFRVERGHGRDRADQDAHGVSVVAESLDQLDQAVVEEEVPADAVLPPLQAFPARQLAVDQQIGDFKIGALLGQLLNRVATILQNALVAINVGNRALARGGVHECRVVGHQPKVVF
jgi:hypothetical protein